MLQSSHLESDMTGKRLAPYPPGPTVIYIWGSTHSGPFGSFQNLEHFDHGHEDHTVYGTSTIHVSSARRTK